MKQICCSRGPTLQTRAELSTEILCKILKLFLDELHQDKKHGFTSRILKSKPWLPGAGSRQAKQKRTGRGQGHGNSFLRCSRQFACWFSGRLKNDDICLLLQCFEKASPRFSRTPRKPFPESPSPPQSPAKAAHFATVLMDSVQIHFLLWLPLTSFCFLILKHL